MLSYPILFVKVNTWGLLSVSREHETFHGEMKRSEISGVWTKELKKGEIMPKLKGLDITYNQIVELVRQLEFEEKVSLIKAVIHEKKYRQSFYRYTESLTKKYEIPMMNEEELDNFLHENSEGR